MTTEQKNYFEIYNCFRSHEIKKVKKKKKKKKKTASCSSKESKRGGALIENSGGGPSLVEWGRLYAGRKRGAFGKRLRRVFPNNGDVEGSLPLLHSNRRLTTDFLRQFSPQGY